MEYRSILIDNIEYVVQEKALNRLFVNIVIVKLEDTASKIHAPYLPVDVVVEKPLEYIIKMANSMQYEKYISMILGHGAVLSDIINLFTGKYKNNQ